MVKNPIWSAGNAAWELIPIPWSILLNTGIDVGISTWKDINASVVAPIKIQNSLEYVEASLFEVGIFFQWKVAIIIEPKVKKSR